MKYLVKVSAASLFLLIAILGSMSSASADTQRDVLCPDGSVVSVGGTVSDRQACQKGNMFTSPTNTRFKKKGSGGNHIMERPMGTAKVKLCQDYDKEDLPESCKWNPYGWGKFSSTSSGAVKFQQKSAR